jgi:hypothetical protein
MYNRNREFLSPNLSGEDLLKRRDTGDKIGEQQLVNYCWKYCSGSEHKIEDRTKLYGPCPLGDA